MVIRAAILSLLLTGLASAQTVFVTTNNFFDLNPSRDQLTGVAGTFRVTHTVTDGADPLSFAGLQSINLRVIDQADGYTNLVLGAISTNEPGVVRWSISTLNARTYRLMADAVFAADTFPVFDRYLTVTSAASSASASVTIPSFGYVAATSTPGHVRIYSGDNMATGTLDGANLSLYLPAAAGDGVGIVSSVVESTVNSWDGATGALTINTNELSTNSVTPVTVSTNVSGNWTIDFRQGAVQYHVQVGAITGQVFTVDSTNNVASVEVILFASTDAVTWASTPSVTWAEGSAPTHAVTNRNRFIFSGHRQSMAGAYLGQTE